MRYKFHTLLKERLHWMQKQMRRLVTFVSGRLRHLIKIGQSVINIFIWVKLSNQFTQICNWLQPFANCR